MVSGCNILYHRKKLCATANRSGSAKAGVLFVKKEGRRPVELIIRKRKVIEKLFLILFICNLICIPLVGVNYDLTKYLPDSASSAQALDIMEQEFT